MKLALQPANRNPCADCAFPKLSYDEALGPVLLTKAPGREPDGIAALPFEILIPCFHNLRIPSPRRPVRIDFYFHDFHTLTNPFSRNSFVCTSIQNHGGVTGGYYPNWFCTCRAARAPSHLSSNLQPLAVSCLSFGSSRPLFSIVCSLFFQNTR